jgi:flagellar biosynthetic protein FliP
MNAADALQIGVTGGGSTSVKVFLLLSALSFAPALVISVTSFTRIIIVLSFLRQALGTPQLPPNPVLIGLAIFLTAFIMRPTLERVHSEALGPYLDDKMAPEEALQKGGDALKAFMLPQTREEDMELFFDIAKEPRPKSIEAIPLTIAVPAFMVSELTTSFRMGLVLFIPMLVVDLLVSAILMSFGMMMVPPQMISLPLKIAVFLMADGWHLVVESLARSFHG